MNRRELLNELMKKYSFEKSHSFIQIATEDRIFENGDVTITMIRTPKADIFNCDWKN